MSKCIYKHFSCRNCNQKDSCNAGRTMIDSSIILRIIKHERGCDVCEDNLHQALDDGMGFITHINLAELYKETLNFIKVENLKEDSKFTIRDKAIPYKLKKYEEIIDSLNKILNKLKIAEIDGEALKYIAPLFNLPRIDMKNRDKIILGTAESHYHKKFLFSDIGIKSSEKSIRDIGFKIELEQISLI